MAMKNSTLMMLIHAGGKQDLQRRPEGFSCAGSVWNGQREISRALVSVQ